LASQFTNLGAQRPGIEWQKPAVGGPFCDCQAQVLRSPDCLAGAGGFEPSDGQPETSNAAQAQSGKTLSATQDKVAFCI
jgi:hypothetical protein